MNQPKKYVLTVSNNFLAGHPKAGQPTGFIDKIKALKKIHTIRDNYEFWEKRVKEIQAGNAVLCIRYWSGRPYHSTQVEIARLKNAGIQKIQIDPILGLFIDDVDSDECVKIIANNDGLSFEDFKAWFKGKLNEPKAIIHFTDLRYK